MPQLYVRAPDGTIGVIPSEQEQDAVNAGYTPVSPEDARGAQESFRRGQGDQAAVTAGVVTAPEDYSQTLAAGEKAVSSATFGLLGNDSAAGRARGQRFAEEHPYKAFGAEVAGQLPLAVAGGAVGEAVVGAAKGAGLAARGGAKLIDWGLQAGIGGAQTEAEESRLSGEDFSWTDAAVTGLAGEALGRGAAWGVSRAVGGSRNLLSKARRQVIADDASASLTKGGWLNDFRVAHHAEAYQNELADLAAKDFDALETNFAEVSRQDRKRARIVRTVADQPEVQDPIRVQAREQLLGLREAISAEVEGAGGPGKHLLKQIDDRIVALDDGAQSGRKLWRLLDENRQALQDYATDLHQSYENNPGSAWLSRDGLDALDAAERTTREALLREDAWGPAAAQAQAAYNVPFHEKYFPTAKTVRGKLLFSPHRDAAGFQVYRGEPEGLRRFFSRDAGDVDGHRLSEQFRDYLDGVEAIAKAGQDDAPQASRNTLEAVRRLRKAAANAEYIQAAVQRTGSRAGLLQAGVEVTGAAVTTAAAGPGAGALGYAALRGARVGDWLTRAGQRLGWGAGEAHSMAALLGKGELPAAAGRDRTVQELLDDVLDAPAKAEPSAPPPGGPGAPPAAPTNAGGALTPSMRADALRGSWAPSEPPGGAGAATGAATGVDDLAPDPEVGGGSLAPPERPTRYVGEREVHAGQQESMELDGLRDAAGPSRREAARLEALTRGEFADVVKALRGSEAPEAKALADQLEDSTEELVEEGLIADRDPFQYGKNVGTPADAVRPTPDAAGGAANDMLDVIKSAEGGISVGELREALGLSREEATKAFMALRDRGAIDVRDGLAFPAEKPALAPGGAAAANAPEQTRAVLDAGLEIRMGADRVPDTLEYVFGPGPAPMTDQWRQVAPLHQLEKIAPVAKARIDILGDAFIWSAEGETSKVAPHTSPDGIYDPGGYDDQSWSISRTFSRDDAGRLEVHHDHFMVRGDLQASGAGAKVLKEMMGVYPKLGVDVVTVDSVEVGKYFWPSIGFNHPDPAVVKRAKDAYALWLVDNKGLSTLEAEAAAKAIKSMPSLAQAEFGKDFLLDVPGPWNFGLRLELSESNPTYHLMRGRLDLAFAAVAGLGSALEGETKDPDGRNAAAQAGVPPQVAAFGATAGLFRAARGKLVREVAKKLFSAVAEPALRTTARLAYSKSQLAQRQEEFHSWQANPQELVDRVAEGLRDAPPEAFSKAAAGVFTTAAFLKEKLPQNSKPSPVALRGVPVSAEAANKYARYEQAALQPGEALREAAEAKYLSPELMETLQALYPDLLAEVRVEAYQTVRAGGPALSIQAKVQYATLFDGDGALADPAFSATSTKMVQMAYDQVAAIAPPKPGAGPRPGVSQTAAAVAPASWGQAGVVA